MVRKMPARVLEGWRRFETFEPFGPRQEDRRAGEIAALIASVYRDKKHHYEAYKPEEFFHSLDSIPEDLTDKKPKSTAKLLQIVEVAFLSGGRGIDNRKKRPVYHEGDK